MGQLKDLSKLYFCTNFYSELFVWAKNENVRWKQPGRRASFLSEYRSLNTVSTLIRCISVWSCYGCLLHQIPWRFRAVISNCMMCTNARKLCHFFFRFYPQWLAMKSKRVLWMWSMIMAVTSERLCLQFGRLVMYKIVSPDRSLWLKDVLY